MKFKSIIMLSIAMFVAPCVYSQKTWSLQDCINYALSNNIHIKRQNNSVNIALKDLNMAKNARLPVISGSACQEFSFGRGLSADNTYTSTNVSTSTFGISVELPIITGFRIPNTVRQKAHLYKASFFDMQKAEDALRIEIIRAFQDVLYKQEQTEISHKQFETDSMQTERLTILVQKGKSSKIDLARQDATTSQSKTKYIQDKNAHLLSLLTLSQLMELPSPEGLMLSAEDIDVEKIQITPPDVIYQSALICNPEILAEKQRLKAYEAQIKIAQGSLYPSLSLAGGAGSRYYHIAKKQNDSFASQLKNNLSEYITLNLSVPIFNRLDTRANIRKSKIQRNDQSLALEEVKKELYQAIQQAYYTAVDAQSRFIAFKESVASTAESLKLVIKKYELGMADITEYNEAKKAHFEAEGKLMQSKYEFIYAIEILNFYIKDTNTTTPI